MSSSGAAEAGQQVVEHGELALRRDPGRVEDRLHAHPVDEGDQPVGGLLDIEPGTQLGQTGTAGPAPVEEVATDGQPAAADG